MAILTSLPGITATVLIDGAVAPEIPDPDEIQVSHKNPRVAHHQTNVTVSRYIQCVTDEPFSIKLKVEPPYRIDCPKLGFEIKVDGKAAWTATAARPRLRESNGKWEIEIEGVKEGKGISCKEHGFRFVEIATECSTSALPMIKRMAERLRPVGTIEIRVFRQNYGRPGGDTALFSNKEGFLGKGGVLAPEKALKGETKSHGAALDAPQKVARGPVWRARKIDGEDWPIAIFQFMYRSETALKDLRLIDRTPSPSPSSSPSRSPSPAPLTEEQERAIEEAERKAREETMRRLGLDSRAGSKDSKAKKIKREHADEGGKVGGNKKARKGKPETIDLTTDDEEQMGMLVPRNYRWAPLGYRKKHGRI